MFFVVLGGVFGRLLLLAPVGSCLEVGVGLAGELLRLELLAEEVLFGVAHFVHVHSVVGQVAIHLEVIRQYVPR